MNIEAIGHALQELRATLDAVPNSREKSLAITKLDEFDMWIDRAIASTR